LCSAQYCVLMRLRSVFNYDHILKSSYALLWTMAVNEKWSPSGSSPAALFLFGFAVPIAVSLPAPGLATFFTRVVLPCWSVDRGQIFLGRVVTTSHGPHTGFGTFVELRKIRVEFGYVIPKFILSQSSEALACLTPDSGARRFSRRRSRAWAFPFGRICFTATWWVVLVINELNVLFCEVLDSAIVASIALQIVDHIRTLLLLVESHIPAEAECTHAHGAEDCNDDHNSYKDWRHILHRVVEVVHLHR